MKSAIRTAAGNLTLPSQLNILKLIFIIFLPCYVILRILIILSSGADYQGVEQNIIYSTQILLSDKNLYASPYHPPFSITQYTPLYYYLIAITAKITGLTPDSISGLYIIGRSWNLIFNAISALFVFKIIKAISNISTFHALFLAIIAFVYNFPHNAAARPDSMHDMFGIMSIYTFIIYQNKKSIYLLLSVVFLTLGAVFSKQSGIQFIIIFLGFCFFIRDYRTFIKMLLLSAIIYGLSLFLFYKSNPYFFDNVIGGVDNGVSFSAFLNYVLFTKVFIVAGLPLVVLFFYFLFKRNLLFTKNKQIQFLAMCALGTFIFATVTGLKLGATSQYYTVFMNLSLILLVSIYEKKKQIIHFAVAYCFIGMLAFSAHHIKTVIFLDHNSLSLQKRTAANEVIDYIKKDSGNLSTAKYIYANLCSDPDYNTRENINNVFFRTCLVPQRDILLSSTHKLKVFGYENFEKLLLSGQVSYIIDSDPNANFEILSNFSSIKSANFSLVKKIDNYLIYKFSRY